jgi:formylglycine-generating enzyme required for sulfatase activity
MLAAVLLLAVLEAQLTARWREPATGMEFVYVAPGEFTLGSPAGEPGREPGEIPHRVRLTRGFWLGATEVTQGQWTRVMGANPSHFADCGAGCPVESVSRLDVERFLARLAELAPGERFRLPSEAEWEFACRAGTSATYATGATLTTATADIDARDDPRAADPSGGAPVFRGRPTPAGSFPANGWGLHDLSGNVWEWTADPLCPYPLGREVTVDPRPACGNPLAVIRGGSWYYGAASARCALRYTHRPQDSGFSLGFRLVREAR